MLVSFLVRVSLKFPGLLGLIPGPWRTDIFLIHLFRNLSWTVGKMVCCPQVELFSTFHSVAWNQFLDLAAYIQNRNLITDSFFFCLWLFFKFIYLFIYFWLCRVLVSVRGLSPVAASGDHSSLRCTGLSLSRPLSLWSTGSRRAGSVLVAHGPSCSAACGIFPDQGSNPCPPHWQADSQPLRHQGSPW